MLTGRGAKCLCQKAEKMIKIKFKASNTSLNRAEYAITR
jgi:predicted RNA-binding protein with PUA domain